MSLTRWNLVSATCRYAFCGGALYWTSVKGFWGGFCESQNLYCGTTKYAKTQVRQIEWRYGIKILRDEEQIKKDLHYNARTYWNIGVQKTFYFLSNMRIILSEQYENIKSGTFLKKAEDDEELEAADYEYYDEDEDDEDETIETKDVAKKTELVAGTGDAKNVDPSGRSATPEPQTDKQKLTAAVLSDEEKAEKARLLEEKIRKDPEGRKAKVVDKIKKIHGME
uniref:Uncharacterized protein n=1 Tax=Strigamia maritima TaxID=126957 RepID=T1JFG7_STRMM